MDANKLDLRILVIKYDLEKVLLENYLEERKILSDIERKVIETYSDNDYDALEFIRDLLIDSDYKEDTKILFENVSRQIASNYPLDIQLYQQISELGDKFITSIDNNTGNNKCLFLPKTRIIK